MIDVDHQLNGMLSDIELEAQLTAAYTGRSKFSTRVMNAIASVPRHEFVDGDQIHQAYCNRALPIASNQTISQPFIVALMTDLLELDEDNSILEIGTGSGYQTAILAELVKQVYSIEILETLSKQAKQILDKLGYRNIEIKTGDGYFGWNEHAPYDRIIVAAVVSTIPPYLIEQLKNNGKMIIPVTYGSINQNLVLLEKDDAGHISERNVLPVAFVPFTRNKEI